MIDITLDIDPVLVEQEIAQALVRKFSGILSSMIGPVRARVAEAIETLIKQSPEYVSLTESRGQLRGELGLIGGGPRPTIDPESFINLLINTIQNNVEVELEPFIRTGSTFVGGLVVRVLRSQFDDLVALSGAVYVSPERGYSIPWLNWLLLGGPGDLITTHWYMHTGETEHRSRTGMGVMVPVGGGHSGWGLGPNGGTPDNNWLTRSLAPLVNGQPKGVIHVILEEELLRRT